MKPDYNNCLLNITSSIMKKYDVESKYSPLPEVTEALTSAKHVFLIVLDGLGKNILEKNLDENSFLRKNVCKWVTSVYPPTTVAATTALLSGLSAGETGWIGWHQYFEDIRQEVVLFRNVDAYTNERLTVEVANTYIPYIPFYRSFRNVECRELYPSFRENGYKTFHQMANQIITISQSEKNTYTYCYWDKPDYTIHELGTTNKTVKKMIYKLNKEIERIYKKCGKDTTIIVVADHGLVDTMDIVLSDYPDIMSCLIQKPSLEARTVTFKVNDRNTFKTLFESYFGKWFDLYDTETFLKEGYLGQEYQKARPYLFDFVALAKDKYNFILEREDFVFKASHAGATEEEFIVPLVLLKK